MSPRIRFIAALAFFAGLIAALPESVAQGAFYDASPGDLNGSPGSIIRREPMGYAPPGSQAWRILYRSRGLRNEPIAVSGVLIVPNASPFQERPIIAWAHPTSGVVPRCAPSLAYFVFQQIQGVREMVEQGYTVVATDYPGLGTAGPHPYLIGVSEARSVLDSVRAARNVLPDASRRFAVWGHSQGGQAALYTGILAHSYAPELRLVGIAAAAPATDLVTLMRDDLNTSGGKGLTAMALWSWTRLYGFSDADILAPSAANSVNALASECIESIYDLLRRRVSEKPLESAFLTVTDITRVEPWRSLMRRNTPGVTPRGVPVLLAQGTADDIVRPDVTFAYMRRLCRAGVAARLVEKENVGHGFIALDSAPEAIAWMADRFAGRTPPNDCAMGRS